MAKQKNNPLKPSIRLLVKLGSAVVHADEYFSTGRHEFDLIAFQQHLADPEVKEWIAVMTKSAFLPVKRSRS